MKKKMLKRDFDPDLVAYCEEKAKHALYSVVEVDVPDAPKLKAKKKAAAKAKPVKAEVQDDLPDLDGLFNDVENI